MCPRSSARPAAAWRSPTIRIACLPHEAVVSLGAVAAHGLAHARCAPRAARVEPVRGTGRASGSGLGASFRAMWVAPFLSVAAISGPRGRQPDCARRRPAVLALWFAAPVIAWWLSRPLRRREARLTAAQARFLRRIARKTWAFFDTFVGEEDNWLPPDNFQEDPGPTIAHRTSPTNIGLMLLANLTAHDFGYISAGIADRADDRDLSHPGPVVPVPRAFLQLVRHADPATAASALRVVGRQRKSRGPPADPACRARCAARPARSWIGRVFDGLADTLAVLADVCTRARSRGGRPAPGTPGLRARTVAPETLPAMREALAAAVGLRGCARRRGEA